MAQEAIGQPLIGLVKFVDSDGLGVTGLTDILTSSWRVTTNGSTLSKTQVLNAANQTTAAMLEIGEGIYGYPIPAASNSAAGQYVYNFTTATAGVVNKSEAATWTVGSEFVENAAKLNFTGAEGSEKVNSHVSSIEPAAVQSFWDRAVSLLTTAGSVGKFIVDRLTLINASVQRIISPYDAATQTLRLVTADSYGGTAGDPVNLPNPFVNCDLTATTEIRVSFFASSRNNDPLFTLLKTSGVNVVSASLAQLTITTANSRKLSKSGQYWHEAVAFFADGSQRTFSMGPVIMEGRYIHPGT